MDTHKIDRLVATEYLGWQPTKWQNHFVNERGNSIDVRDTFTKKIDLAWAIAEKMKERWPDFSISKDEDGNWNVGWGFDGYGWPDISAETAPMALSLACLKSIDVNIDEFTS